MPDELFSEKSDENRLKLSSSTIYDLIECGTMFRQNRFYQNKFHLFYGRFSFSSNQKNSQFNISV